MLEALVNEPIPVRENTPGWKRSRDFHEERAQKIHGAWPVHFVDQEFLHEPDSQRYSGFRVLANCSSFLEHDPDAIEKAILIWYDQDIKISFHDLSPRLAEFPWDDFVEAVDY